MRSTPSDVVRAVGLCLALSSADQLFAASDAAGRAARTRQEAARTVDITFKQTEIIARGAITTLRTAPAKPVTLRPEKETSLESTNRIVFDGGKVRFENNYSFPSQLYGQAVQANDVTAFNGSRSIFLHTAAEFPHPFATITKGSQINMQLPALLPIQMTFRGAGNYPYSTSDNKSGSTLVDGVVCDEFTTAVKNGTMTCWLDPGKGYSPRRIRTQLRSGVTEQLDVCYRQEETCGWVPTSWTHKQIGRDGTVLITMQVNVVSMRLNVPQEAQLFDITLPPQTGVNDYTKGAAPAYFIVENDGSKRAYSPFQPPDLKTKVATGLRAVARNAAVLATPSVTELHWYEEHKRLMAGILSMALALLGLLYLLKRHRTSAVWKKTRRARD